jgi:SAM-dependent methyltransferase
MSSDARAIWDAAAEEFDKEPDHGLLDPTVRAGWRQVLQGVLPPVPARVLDLGCGTGSLSRTAGDDGPHGHGCRPVPPRMIQRAEAKARRHGVDIALHVGDAAFPEVGASFDVVLTHHLLWAIADPAAAVTRWFDLLTGDGRLVLIEGRWHTGAGLAASEVLALVSGHSTSARVQLLDDPALWAARSQTSATWCSRPVDRPTRS